MRVTKPTRRRKGKSARQKKKKEARPPLAYLRRQPLIEFLNLNFSAPIQSGSISGELQMLIHRHLGLGSLENLKVLQEELIEVLSPIASIPDGGLKRFRRFGAKKMQTYLQSLIDKINKLKFTARFVLLSGEKELFGLPNTARQLLNRDQRIFSWGAQWIVTTEFSAGIGYSPRLDFYGMIAEGLITGELARLRRCRCPCQEFFVPEDPRSKYFPGHMRLYHDKLHGSERVKSWRDRLTENAKW
jgi:hypothetical protein